jgi:2-polyprenyl-3-methyl-5-hydroxy-6-metoxy-1,4-benzoquinol methylase
VYNPLTGVWSRGHDLDVNYMVAAVKPAGPPRA